MPLQGSVKAEDVLPRRQLKTFKEYPPRQKPSSFSIDKAMEQAMQAQTKLAGTTGGGPR